MKWQLSNYYYIKWHCSKKDIAEMLGKSVVLCESSNISESCIVFSPTPSLHRYNDNMGIEK